MSPAMSLDPPPAPALDLAPDRFLDCRNCGITFVWTGWEQQEGGAPEHCPGCRHVRALTQRQGGAVKWYDGRKGFGFITAADGSEIFVHRQSLGNLRGLRRGQVVAYRIEMTENGPQATDIQRPEQSPSRGKRRRKPAEKPA